MIAEAITAVSTVVSKTMDKLPNYDQKKKEKWEKLQLSYRNEMKKEIIAGENGRDDDLIMRLREEILIFSTTFAEEIE